MCGLGSVERLEPPAHLIERRGVDQQEAGAQGRKILEPLPDAAIGGDARRYAATAALVSRGAISAASRSRASIG